MSRSIPDVHYARTADGVNIAYTMAGSGPPMVYVRALNSHAQRIWDDVRRRPYLLALTHAFTVITFDARGNGLSDPVGAIDLDALVEDVRAVTDDLSLDRFVLYGQGFGSPVAISFAARRPERVEQLLLYCAYVRGTQTYIPDFFMDALRESPQTAAAIIGHATYPDEYRLSGRDLTLSSISATPETTALYFEFARTVDVSAEAPEVQAPTLVMQPKANRVVPVELGEEVASLIPRAMLELVSTGSYNPWGTEAVEPTLVAISEFTARPIPLMPPSRPMALLVTDLVGSTEMTHRLGEERARELFRAHDAIVREARRQHGGIEVKHTGDGIMIRFDDVASAGRCAVAIQERLTDRNESVSDDPLNVRVGLSYGEVVEEQEDVFGTTVVLAVRIMDQGAAGQILASRSVCDALGGLYEFGPPAATELKGFPEPVDVYELVWTS